MKKTATIRCFKDTMLLELEYGPLRKLEDDAMAHAEVYEICAVATREIAANGGLGNIAYPYVSASDYRTIRVEYCDGITAEEKQAILKSLTVAAKRGGNTKLTIVR